MFIKYAPRKSAIVREINGEAVASWTIQTELLHAIEHSLRILIWSRTKDAQKGVNQPEALPVPQAKKKDRPKPRMSLAPSTPGEPTVLGGEGVTLERMAEILGWDPETGKRLDV